MSASEVFIQQIITGLSNGMIITLIALGYTMVYGIVELINFAHGDLFMLGTFLALTLVGALSLDPTTSSWLATSGGLALLMLVVPLFCIAQLVGGPPCAQASAQRARLAPLVSAIGVSFTVHEPGMAVGGLPMDVFGGGRAALPELSAAGQRQRAALAGHLSQEFQFTYRDLFVFGNNPTSGASLSSYAPPGQACVYGPAPVAARLMGIDVSKVLGDSLIGGALAGFAAVIYPLFNPTIYFQLGFRTGMDAFTAAVLGGIGNLPGAALGGLCIGMVRAMSDQYIATQWTNSIVFAVLVLILIFRPSGLLGARTREKV
jgi:branched-chain amino acid transport system permease protein